MPRSKLTPEARIFILERLARFVPPQDVAEAVRLEFGFEVSRQLVETHDPTKAAGKDLAPKWRDIFVTARAAFEKKRTQLQDDVSIVSVSVSTKETVAALVDAGLMKKSQAKSPDALGHALERLVAGWVADQRVDGEFAEVERQWRRG